LRSLGCLGGTGNLACALSFDFVNLAANRFGVEARKADGCKYAKILAIRKCFLLCCERLDSVSNIGLAIRNGTIVARREARNNSARPRTAPHKSVPRSLNANP